jgi:hypothetical protein
LKTSGIGPGPITKESSTSTGATNIATWALDPIAMLTERSILSLTATSTATQCSAALPTIATTMIPMKNSLSPIDSEAASIDPTRISDITPTATPATASAITDFRTDQPQVSSCSDSSSECGLNSSLWVRRLNTSPAT